MPSERGNDHQSGQSGDQLQGRSRLSSVKDEPPEYRSSPRSSAPPPAYGYGGHRSSSVEPRRASQPPLARKSPDTRAVQAVPPFETNVDSKFGESVVLKQLFQEAAVSGHLPVNGDSPFHHITHSTRRSSAHLATSMHEDDIDDEEEHQRQSAMIDNYQAHLFAHQHDHHHELHSASDHATNQLAPRAIPSVMSHSQPNLNNLIKSDGVRQVHQAQLITVNNNDSSPFDHSSYRQQKQSQQQQQQQQQQQPTGRDQAPPPYRSHANTVSTVAAADADSRRSEQSFMTGDIYDSPQVRVASRMVNLLSEENKSLRKQLDTNATKIIKLQQLEHSYQRIQHEYEDLVRHKEKQEALEKHAAQRLEAELQRLQRDNALLLERNQLLESHLSGHVHSLGAADNSEEIHRLNLLIDQLVPQNKQLLECKERQALEIHAQNATLEDQRKHIAILDKALKNAQEKVTRKENECQQLARAADRNAELQQALQASVADKQERDEAHKRVKAQLEMEIAQLKMQLAKENVSLVNGGIKKSSASINRSSLDVDETVAKLRREMDTKDERIMTLEKRLVELEAKYQSEVRRRNQMDDDKSDTASARISDLEEAKLGVEKLAADLRAECEHFRHSSVDYKTLIASLESKMHQMEARLAEKDSMIDVLKKQQQQHLPSAVDSSVRSQAYDRSTAFHPIKLSSGPSELSRFRLEQTRLKLLQSASAGSRRGSSSWTHHGKLPASLDASFSSREMNSREMNSREINSREINTLDRVRIYKERSESSGPTVSRRYPSLDRGHLRTASGGGHLRTASGGGHLRTASGDDYLLSAHRFSSSALEQQRRTRASRGTDMPPSDEQVWDV